MLWLDGYCNFVRVLSFDFSKAFDSVTHRILTDNVFTFKVSVNENFSTLLDFFLFFIFGMTGS